MHQYSKSITDTTASNMLFSMTQYIGYLLYQQLQSFKFNVLYVLSCALLKTVLFHRAYMTLP